MELPAVERHILCTIRCSMNDGNGRSVEKTTLYDLYEKEGQSPWYDNLCRPLTDLIPLIENGVRGVTSNPVIFQEAILTSSAYNDQINLTILYLNLVDGVQRSCGNKNINVKLFLCLSRRFLFCRLVVWILKAHMCRIQASGKLQLLGGDARNVGYNRLLVLPLRN